MDKGILSKFRFEDYKIEDIDFKINNRFNSEESVELDLKLNVQVGMANNSTRAKVTLYIVVFDDAEEKNYPFTIRSSITGWFSSNDDIKPEEFVSYCKLNGTAALFPYLRAAITDITKISNVQPPLVLPLINVYNLIRENDSVC